MTKAEARKLTNGLYRIYWKKDERTSLASVGRLHDGTPWFAPTNWTYRDAAGIASTWWGIVKSVTLISTDEETSESEKLQPEQSKSSGDSSS